MCHSGMCHWLTSPKAGTQPPFLSPSVRLGIGVWFLDPFTELLVISCLCGSPGVGWVGWASLTAPPAEVLHEIIQNNSSGKGEGENA